MSLRARLLAASLALVVVGLGAADVATFHALRSFLYQRVDDQLSAASHSVTRAVFSPDGPFAAAQLRQLGTVVPGVYVQVRDLRTSLDQAVSLGGSITLDPFDVPGGPSLAGIKDPEGNPLMLVQQ